MARKVVCKNVSRPTKETEGRTNVFEFTLSESGDLVDPIMLGYLTNQRMADGYMAFYMPDGFKSTDYLGFFPTRSQASHAVFRHKNAILEGQAAEAAQTKSSMIKQVCPEVVDIPLPEVSPEDFRGIPSPGLVMSKAEALEFFNCSADALRKRVARGKVLTVELPGGSVMYLRG